MSPKRNAPLAERLVMRASPIHGVGVFATHAIPAGALLFWVTGGIIYGSEDWRMDRVQLDPEQYNEAQIDDDLFIATPKTLHYYVNHSCDPNALNETAWRDIQPGEEITTDYACDIAGPNYRLEPCTCGSPMCRERVKGSDWRLPELQERYRGHFTPHIERLIQQLHTGATP